MMCGVFSTPPKQQLGKVDVLINNAGVMKTTPLAETSDALYDQTFDINVRGTFNTLREAATRMNDGGRIVNFSTTALALNMPGYAIYNATKAAVESFTHVFAKELRGRNITVNAVAPGRLRRRCSSMARPKNRSRPSRRCRRCNVSANRKTLPRWCRSSPVRMRAGSMARSCARTAVLREFG